MLIVCCMYNSRMVILITIDFSLCHFGLLLHLTTIAISVLKIVSFWQLQNLFSNFNFVNNCNYICHNFYPRYRCMSFDPMSHSPLLHNTSGVPSTFNLHMLNMINTLIEHFLKRKTKTSFQ